MRFRRGSTQRQQQHLDVTDVCDYGFKDYNEDELDVADADVFAMGSGGRFADGGMSSRASGGKEGWDRSRRHDWMLSGSKGYDFGKCDEKRFGLDDEDCDEDVGFMGENDEFEDEVERQQDGGLYDEDEDPVAVPASMLRRRRTRSRFSIDLGCAVKRARAKKRLSSCALFSSLSAPSVSRRSSAVPRRVQGDKAAYRAYFRLIAEDPSEELAVVKDLTAPIIRSSPVTLPFDLSQAVADNCLSLSGMGYSLGVGGCCPTCTSRGEPRLGRLDRAALILAYVQQINDIYHYRAFMASIVALAAREEERRGGYGGGADNGQASPPEQRGGEGGGRAMTEAVLAKALARPELFFAYYVLRDGGAGDARVLFYPDHEASGDYMMYVVFSGKSVHLHHRLLDCLQAACRGYRLIAHVWQTAFVLVVRRESDRQTETERVPSVNAEDVYCKLCDLNIDGELLLEYAKLYSIFDDFLPPR